MSEFSSLHVALAHGWQPSLQQQRSTPHVQRRCTSRASNARPYNTLPCRRAVEDAGHYGCSAEFALPGDGSIVPSGMIDPYGCGVFGRVTRPLRGAVQIGGPSRTPAPTTKQH